MFLKSIFITLYISFLHLSAGFSGWQIFHTGFDWLWLGVLLTALPGVLVFDILLLAKPVARTKNHLAWIIGIKLFGLILVGLINLTASSLNYVSLWLAFTGSMGWLAYDYWFSLFPKRNKTRLAIGHPLPEMNFLTTEQVPFNTHKLRGAPALILFYRGNWCPLCMAQINEIAAQYQQLAELGVQVLLISPQSHQQSKKLADRFKVPFTFLVDKDCQVAKSLGIFAENGLPLGMQLFGYDSDTVMPTAIMTDAQGTIIFADLTDNYRIRPEPATFLAVLRQHQA